MVIDYKDNYIYVKDGDIEVGYIKYDKVNEYIIDVKTTYVSDNYRGQGIAGKLFNELVKFSRSNNFKIIASCSYIKKKLESSTEYQDIYCHC